MITVFVTLASVHKLILDHVVIGKNLIVLVRVNVIVDLEFIQNLA